MGGEERRGVEEGGVRGLEGVEGWEGAGRASED